MGASCARDNILALRGGRGQMYHDRPLPMLYTVLSISRIGMWHALKDKDRQKTIEAF